MLWANNFRSHTKISAMKHLNYRMVGFLSKCFSYWWWWATKHYCTAWYTRVGLTTDRTTTFNKVYTKSSVIFYNRIFSSSFSVGLLITNCDGRRLSMHVAMIIVKFFQRLVFHLYKHSINSLWGCGTSSSPD